MAKKNTIFSIVFLFGFVILCCFNTSQVNTRVEVDDKESQIRVTVLSTPKSSAYDVSEEWNYTTASDVQSVDISADGRYMVIGTQYTSGTGEKYNTLFLKKTSTNETIWVYNTSAKVNSVAISADGKYIACGSVPAPNPWDHNLYLFDNSIPVGNKEPLWSYNTTAEVTSVDISADGKYIIASGFPTRIGFNILLFNNSVPLGDKRAVWTYRATVLIPRDVNSVAISSNGEYIVAGGNSIPGFDNLLFFNNSYASYSGLGTTKQPEWNYKTGVDVNSVAISAKGEYVVAGCDSTPGDEIFLFNKSAEGVKQPEWSHSAGNIKILSVAISETNGEYIAAGGNDPIESGRLYFFNRSDYKGQPMWEYNPSSWVKSVAITALGEYIVAGTYYNSGGTQHLYLFNNSAEGVKKPEWSFEMDYYFNSVSISSWGNYIAAGGTYASGRAYLFYHARPIPRIISGNGGGDDDDDDEGAIPFGNHYLLFTAIAVVSLVLVTKRKVIFSKK